MKSWKVLPARPYGAAAFLFAWGLTFAATPLCQGAPLNLVQMPPDITSSFVGVSYNANTDIFTASGVATNFEINGIAPPDYTIQNGTFNIQIGVDGSGQPSDLGAPLGLEIR